VNCSVELYNVEYVVNGRQLYVFAFYLLNTTRRKRSSATLPDTLIFFISCICLRCSNLNPNERRINQSVVNLEMAILMHITSLLFLFFFFLMSGWRVTISDFISVWHKTFGSLCICFSARLFLISNSTDNIDLSKSRNCSRTVVARTFWTT
jgi:hypothetical protein